MKDTLILKPTSVCEYCDRTFDLDGCSFIPFCSRHCEVKYEQKKRERMPRICDNCGKEYLWVDRRGGKERRFCSQVCRKQAWQKRRGVYKGFAGDSAECPECGTKFIKDHGKQIYCKTKGMIQAPTWPNPVSKCLAIAKSDVFRYKELQTQEGRDYHNNKNREQYWRRKNAGVCVRCADPNLLTETMCMDCADINNSYQ